MAADLDDALLAALDALAATESLLVALDFDGTLAPFVLNPADARVTPAARAAITELHSLPRTVIAYVSGRPIASLARLSEAGPDDLLIGSHGVEERLDGRRVELALEQAERERLAALDAALEEVRGRHPAVRIERKPAGLGLHTRGVGADETAAAFADARAAAEAVGDGFVVRAGKDILEFAVRADTKGDGIRRLQAHTEATGVFFAGDDVTDEDGFLALTGPDDVGVKVGEGASAAAHRVADPDALAAVLTVLAARRRILLRS